MRISHIVLDPTLAMLTETGVTDLVRKTRLSVAQNTKINEKMVHRVCIFGAGAI
jgi:hypothetical protein